MSPRRLTNDCARSQSRRPRRQTSNTRTIVLLLACATLCAAAVLLPLGRARAADGDLDPTFDTDGKQTTDFFGDVDGARAVAVQADGKYVVAGQALHNSNTEFALARYNTDGSLDTSFGSGGKVTTAFATGNSVAYDVVVQADGKIIAVGGGTSGSFELARYNTDGSPDNSFDGDGKLTINISGGASLAESIIIQPDGKLVVAGSSQQSAIVRLNPDGSLDASFGTGGIVHAVVGVHTLALQPDGKIIAGVEAGVYYALARYNNDGSLDKSFGFGGEVVITPSSVGQGVFKGTSVLVQPDGRIVAGVALKEAFVPVQSMRLMRFNKDGSPDQTFGNSGEAVVTDFGNSLEQHLAIAQQADGKIIAAGMISPRDFALARFNVNGSLDQTFGRSGRINTDFSGGQDVVRGIALQGDGKFVAVGLADGKDFGIARYQGDTPAPVCLYTVVPARQVVPVGGGTGTFEVNASAGCSWSAVSNDPTWLDITSAASGTGDGQITYTARRHDGVGLRTGTITVAGQTFTVVQGGPKVLILAGRTQLASLATLSTNLVGTGLIAQADAFVLAGEVLPPLAFLQRYDAVLYFVGYIGPPTEGLPAEPVAMGNLLADYVDAGGGVVIGNFGWNNILAPISLLGRIRTDSYSPYGELSPGGHGSFPLSPGGPLTKLQPRHPILANVSSVSTANSLTFFNMPLTAGAERVADWSNDRPAVATKQPTAGRVVGLNLYPLALNLPSAGADGTRLLANSLTWAANTNRAISGRVTNAAGQGLGGVTLTLNDELTTQTDAGGNYVFFPRAGGNYTVTASGQSVAFTPASRTFLNLTIDQQAADFTTQVTPQAVVQFSTTALNFNESHLRATLTLTRTNDLSATTTVNYRTVDDPASIPCANTTMRPGVAFARCDYATSLDTVTFAPGETQKTITVPIINDAHVEPDETFQVFLSSPSAGAALGANTTLTVTIQDDDAPGQANPVFMTPFFVRQLYLDFLGREPEASEPWSNLLNNCADVNNLDPNSPAAGCDRITVAGSFFGSPEFSFKGIYVFNFYQVAFHRSLLPTYAEIIPDIRAVTGRTASEVFQKRAQFAVAFTERREFRTHYDGLNNETYVAALLGYYYNVNSITTPDPTAPDGDQYVTLTKTELTNQLTAGALTRAQVLRAIVQSREVISAEAHRAFVAMQYYGFLRRTPDTPGFNAWLNYLNTHPTDFRTMVNGFVNSQEYRLRFGAAQ